MKEPKTLRSTDRLTSITFEFRVLYLHIDSFSKGYEI